MTIEEKLVRDCGLTEDPCMGVWLLRDGRLVNGSHEGFQRDIDHHEIGQYFKRSKFEEPGTNGIYMLKFMRRGNIRWGCSEFGYCVEHVGPPSHEQFLRIRKHMLDAMDAGIDTGVGRRVAPGRTVYMPYLEWLRKYVRPYTRLCNGIYDWTEMEL